MLLTVRLPRFTRVADALGCVLMERDTEILRWVARFRFLNSAQLIRLTGGSPQPILRRLQRLYHHGYLDRPRAQIDYFHRGGSKPLVYGLGRKATVVLFPDGDARPRLDNHLVGRLYLQHTLLIADVLIALELACRQKPELRFLSADQLRRDDGFHWAVTVRHRNQAKRVGLIPDGVFALEDRCGERAYFFLEADRGTMPVRRGSLNQSSFFRKLLAYEATWSQGLHEHRFGFHRFRVLTVTQSRKRAEHLAEAAEALPRGHGLFVFASLADLTLEQLLSEPVK